MIGALLPLVVIGAAVGYAAATFMRLRVSRPVAVGAGAVGAIVGGLAMKFLLGIFGAIIGAVFAAAFVIALGHAMSRD